MSNIIWPQPIFLTSKLATLCHVLFIPLSQKRFSFPKPHQGLSPGCPSSHCPPHPDARHFIFLEYPSWNTLDFVFFSFKLHFITLVTFPQRDLP